MDKTQEQIENDICEILINHGPDGHTDGSDYITAYIMELLKANHIQPSTQGFAVSNPEVYERPIQPVASKSDEEISDKEKVAIILNGWESEYELKAPSKELQQKILIASYAYTLEQQLDKQNQAVAELVEALKFYASKNEVWLGLDEDVSEDMSTLIEDNGQIARQALAKFEKGE